MYHAIVFLPLLGAIIAGLFGTALFRNLGSDAAVYGGHHGHGDHAHGHEAHGHDDHGHGGHYHGPAWPMYLTTALLFVAAVLSWVNLVELPA
jgi:NADH-quinone oxidoreductase subunit L